MIEIFNDRLDAEGVKAFDETEEEPGAYYMKTAEDLINRAVQKTDDTI